ncbi:MAG: response regulator [Planctomycetes bacterium]|nr:response regulator [Planctomycetota bacterium]
MALIYVVEDSPAQRELVRAALEPLGHELRVFPDGRAARQAIREAPPDLLVADIVLPGVSGLELCQEVRERHRRLELPVVLVSSLDQVDDLARGYEAGADDYLVKPVDPGELRRKTQLLLDRRAQRSQPTSGWTRYALLGPVGKGQTAAITRARRKGDGLEVALKASPPGAGREAVDRLLAEAELLRSLEGVPGVVRVRDVGSDGGATYYAMDLVDGETLRARLDRGVLPPAEAAAIGRGLATTLAGLARAGVVHGDVKPDNVLLAPGGPVLVDFGLARRVGEPAPSAVGGTLTHLAPEVVRGAPASPASDLYALGVVLFEALCGRLPYAASGADLAASKVEGAPPDLEPLLALDVAPGLVAVVEEALATTPEGRAPDAEAVAAALLPYAR